MTRGTIPPDLLLLCLLLLLSRALNAYLPPPPPVPFPLPSSQSRRVVSAICMYLRCQFPKTVICRALNRFGLLFTARLIVTRDPGRFRVRNGTTIAEDSSHRTPPKDIFRLRISKIVSNALEIFREKKKSKKILYQSDLLYLYWSEI